LCEDVFRVGNFQPNRESPAASGDKKRIPELDGLRGIAILLVLLYHYFSLVSGKPLPWLQRTFAMGWSGVDLFFVLSGFLIGGILLDARESPNYFSTFYGRRVFRIMPLYYVWIVAYFAIAAFIGNPETWHSVPIYILFLQNSAKINHADLGTAWLGHLWSLAVEEQFYLIIPLAIRFLARRTLFLLMCFVVVSAPVARVLFHQHLPAHPAAQYILTVCNADALAVGVLLAIVWRNEQWKTRLRSHKTLLGWVILPLLGISLYLLVRQPSQYSMTMAAWGFSIVVAFFAGLLTLAIMVPGGMWAAVCRWSLLAEMGRVSYCLYIIHQVVNLACYKILLHSLPRADSWATVGVSVLAALVAYGIATLSWKFFEHPMIRLGHRYTY
jgi:peptidoglycan/LPS O-acetylase OafA/YrhL